MKPRETRWAGHVAHMETGELRTKLESGDLKERDHLAYTVVVWARTEINTEIFSSGLALATAGGR